MKMKEEWAVIPGYDGKYEVSSFGRVKRIIQLKHRRKEIINFGTRHHRNYMLVTLYKGKEKKTIFVHRLVAEAFIPNQKNLPMLNHKDENGMNNHVDNLEWCDAKYNTNYGTAIERRTKKMRIPVCCYEPDGSFVGEYESLTDAVNKTGVDMSSLLGCCAGRFAHCSGKIWVLKNDIGTLPGRLRQYKESKHSIRVKITGIDGKIFGEFDSFMQAERTIGVCKAAIKKYLNGAPFYSKALKEVVRCVALDKWEL